MKPPRSGSVCSMNQIFLRESVSGVQQRRPHDVVLRQY